ncbi:hypothetical protein RFI_25343 [Reticulomyxa filosa]|uniref:Uncharacterized protein n=1 Tax=Reticulomyxa filosa TaxID=46433 RepID=X6MDD2_RETFI|nr:hypothetical protein RFI_25343 [Reticulomyxa filosa]|eukprot:ETO12033.1 hypothetical protein RFI_25343 [Reticulomyxa filosa]
MFKFHRYDYKSYKLSLSLKKYDSSVINSKNCCNLNKQKFTLHMDYLSLFTDLSKIFFFKHTRSNNNQIWDWIWKFFFPKLVYFHSINFFVLGFVNYSLFGLILFAKFAQSAGYFHITFCQQLNSIKLLYLWILKKILSFNFFLSEKFVKDRNISYVFLYDLAEIVAKE